MEAMEVPLLPMAKELFKLIIDRHTLRKSMDSKKIFRDIMYQHRRLTSNNFSFFQNLRILITFFYFVFYYLI